MDGYVRDARRLRWAQRELGRFAERRGVRGLQRVRVAERPHREPLARLALRLRVPDEHPAQPIVGGIQIAQPQKKQQLDPWVVADTLGQIQKVPFGAATIALSGERRERLAAVDALQVLGSR